MRPIAAQTYSAVLVLDDNPAVADATGMLLEAVGHAVVVAADLTQARQLAAGKALNLLICDYHLGSSENGVDAIRALREASGFDVPAILVSGDTSSKVLTSVESVPKCHILTKPFDADQLVSLTMRLLSA